MAKTGPKPKLTPAKKKAFLRDLRLGLSQKECRTIYGIGVATLHDAAAKDPEFRKGLKSAHLEGKRFHLRRITRASKGWQASAWFLERKYGVEFKKRIEHIGEDGKPLRRLSEVTFILNEYSAIFNVAASGSSQETVLPDHPAKQLDSPRSNGETDGIPDRHGA